MPENAVLLVMTEKGRSLKGCSAAIGRKDTGQY